MEARKEYMNPVVYELKRRKRKRKRRIFVLIVLVASFDIVVAVVFRFFVEANV